MILTRQKTRGGLRSLRWIILYIHLFVQNMKSLYISSILLKAIKEAIRTMVAIFLPKTEVCLRIYRNQSRSYQNMTETLRREEIEIRGQNRAQDESNPRCLQTKTELSPINDGTGTVPATSTQLSTPNDDHHQACGEYEVRYRSHGTRVVHVPHGRRLD